MGVRTAENKGPVKIFGTGSAGGKGAGLIKLDEFVLPKVRPLRTWILKTSFYDRYLENRRSYLREANPLLGSILEELGDIPVGVRSSATNEAAATAPFRAVHAGENISYMLPNNHPDPRVRLAQAVRAVGLIYDDFRRKQPPESREKMAIVINPIPGILDDTLAGPVYYPYISGVADSFFPHALKNQKSEEGFARVAFGHGYATVLDDFPVISMATIRNPIPLHLLQTGQGQQFFYALDLTKNRDLRGEDLETMRKLHVRFANFHKIKRLGLKNNLITIEEFVQNDHFEFRTGLVEIMETLAAGLSSRFQIEFVFNLEFVGKDAREGAFHLVQLTLLPERTFEALSVPARVRRTYLSISNTQGHGIQRNIRTAVVISPFVYAKEMQSDVRRRISQVNETMKDRREKYILVVPGRLGSKNLEWGIFVEYKDVDQAAAIFEYGVDIAGRAEPLPEKDSLTGGVYGSHFLYMIQGGFDEDQKKLQTRMYGTQGTHFLTNLMSNNVVYGYVAPDQAVFDAWFFSDPNPETAVSVLTFPSPVTVLSDSQKQICRVYEA